MTRKFQSLALFVLGCLSLTAEAQQGPLFDHLSVKYDKPEPHDNVSTLPDKEGVLFSGQPLQNVSIKWINDFEVQVSWAPVENCTYAGLFKRKGERKPNIVSPWKQYVVMEGGSLQLHLETDCHDSPKYETPINITYPDLVRDLQCYIYATNKSRCSWSPASQHVPNPRFFYRLVNEDFTASANQRAPLLIKECSSYQYNAKGVRTGCDLDADIVQDIDISFIGTVNNTLARNTFKKVLEIRPPALNWTVTKTGNKFNIRWTPPAIAKSWTFELQFTECNKTQTRQFKEETFELVAVPHCSYSMAGRAVTSGGETPWSKEKHFDADVGPNGWLYAAIVIPLMFGVLAVLIFVCCKKNKESIFPKVPEPRDLLTDISDNNNKCTVRNLYILAEEEETCKITLVVDPQISKPDF